MWHKRKETEQQTPLTGERLLHRHRQRDYEKRSRRCLFFAFCMVGIAALTVMVSYSGARLALYLWQGERTEQIGDSLREVYYAEQADQAQEPPPEEAPPPQEQEAAPQPSYGKILPAKEYPSSAGAMTAPFRQLRLQNPDIIGWLNIDGLLDEAVVHRDNEYYLRRDYMGQHNVNGSIFLDESCDLRERPYTYILYGHNMKTQAMFGGLHHFNTPDYYRAHPFISFDTIYETGRFVIFSVITASLQSEEPLRQALNKLESSTVMWREEAIAFLQEQSRYSTVIDVAVDDQVLVLVTCISEDSDKRRVVVARRIRPDEDEADLLARIKRSYRWR